MIDIRLDVDTILIWILVGLVAGALASRVALGHGLGLLGDLVAGVLGAFIGGILAQVFKTAASWPRSSRSTFRSRATRSSPRWWSPSWAR